MIRIQNITVRNFKNIEFADLDLNSVNVIIGPNGSGKTNFLMIFRLLKQILRGSNDVVEELFEDGYNLFLGTILPTQLQDNKDCSISLSFHDSDFGDIYRYSISITPTNKSSSLAIRHEEFSFKKKSATGLPTTIFIRDADKLTFHPKIKRFLPIVSLKGYVSGIKPIELVQDSLEIRFKNAFQVLEILLDSPTLYLSPHKLKISSKLDLSILDDRVSSIEIEKTIIEIAQTDNWQYLKDSIKFATGIDDIIINNGANENLRYVSFRFLNKINLTHHLSDGMLLLIGIVLQIVTSRSDIILLEEPENSIHPKALSSLMGFIRSRSDFNQFIMTTHSTTLLNLLSPSEILVSEIQKNGLSTIAHISNEKELKRKLSKGFASLGDLVFQGETEFEDLF